MKIMIVAGGTGGHIYPGIAVATALMKEGVEVIWLGTKGGMEQRIVAAEGIDVESLGAVSVRGRNLFGKLFGLSRALVATVAAVVRIWRIRPNAILGMGGYVSGPGCLAAWLCRIPLVIHEQNSVAGLTNRILAPLATRVTATYENSFGSRSNVMIVGNPVRESFISTIDEAKQGVQISSSVNLLVMGGSRGADALNSNIPKLLAAVDTDVKIHIFHQCGLGNAAVTRIGYEQHSIRAEVADFVDDPAKLFLWADIAICRAGATTLAELQAAGLGAILIPYPFAVDDHQKLNAMITAKMGGAIVVEQNELLTANGIAQVTRLLNSKEMIVQLGEAARHCALKDAAINLAKVSIAVASKAPALEVRK